MSLKLRKWRFSSFENNTGQTDGRTDGRTDTTSYRDAKSHLKTSAWPSFSIALLSGTHFLIIYPVLSSSKCHDCFPQNRSKIKAISQVPFDSSPFKSFSRPNGLTDFDALRRSLRFICPPLYFLFLEMLKWFWKRSLKLLNCGTWLLFSVFVLYYCTVFVFYHPMCNKNLRLSFSSGLTGKVSPSKRGRSDLLIKTKVIDHFAESHNNLYIHLPSNSLQMISIEHGTDWRWFNMINSLYALQSESYTQRCDTKTFSLLWILVICKWVRLHLVCGRFQISSDGAYRFSAWCWACLK